MHDDAREAIDRLERLWRAERRGARRRHREERQRLPLAERVRRGLALARLRAVDAGPAPGDLVLVWLEPARKDTLRGLRLGPGDPVLLWREDPEGPEAVRGTLARRAEGRVGVMVPAERFDRLPDADLCLDEEENEATFDRGLAALRAFRDAPARSPQGRLRAVLFAGAAPEFGPEPELEFFDRELNEPQRRAVRRALAARDLFLVHGPPGTGKTRTLVEVVRHAVSRGARVLATAASNTAVDNLAERLVLAGLDAVRLGHPSRVSSAMEPRLLSAQVDASPAAAQARAWLAQARRDRARLDRRRAKGKLDWREDREARAELGRLYRDARAQLRGVQEAILAGAQVVCATAAGADAELLGDERFDLVVVDEATQAPDPVLLVALRRAERAVLAGDPRQLPPTVVDPQAAREGLAETAFERLEASRGDELLCMLTVQHRMHEGLMAFPSASLYEGRLVAAPEVAARCLEELPGVRPDPLRPGPLVFVDTAGKGWEEERGPDDPSTANPLQAERTAREVRRLLARGLPSGELGVVAPYYAQVRILRELLAPEVSGGLEVSSVDGFQGREKEALVVDLVRSNDAGRLGFLRDVRRMNVALTRARRFLLVVGDSATLGDDPYYAAFLAEVERQGAYLSAWSDEAEPLLPE
ncbi:MAG: AAA family ATPase [Planctomycetota bacterium]|nr:MAG: AAA family ATPase [Planctomycetota bacterium]